MLTLPIEIANPPKQPVYPTQIVRGLPGVKHWWTTHREETIAGADGKRRVRPRAGGLQLVENAPLSYASQTDNGKIRTPAVFPIANGGDYYTADVALAPGWSSILSVQKRNPGQFAGEIWSIQVNAAVMLFLTPARTSTGGGAAFWVDGGAQLNGVPDLHDNIFVSLVAFDTVSGQAKRMVNLTTVETATLTELTGAAPTATSRLNFGAKITSQKYGGWGYELGVFSGDLTANPDAIASIKTYLNALYGMTW